MSGYIHDIGGRGGNPAYTFNSTVEKDNSLSFPGGLVHSSSSFPLTALQFSLRRLPSRQDTSHRRQAKKVEATCLSGSTWLRTTQEEATPTTSGGVVVVASAVVVVVMVVVVVVVMVVSSAGDTLVSGQVMRGFIILTQLFFLDKQVFFSFSY